MAFLGISPTIVNTTLTGDQFAPVITTVGLGHVIVWRDDAGVYYGQRFDGAGQAIPAFEIEVATPGDFAPQVASLAGGGFVVLLAKDDADSVGVYAQRFNSLGAKVGGEELVNVTQTGHQFLYKVASVDSGAGYAVVWSSEEALTEKNVYLRLFNADGTAQTNEITISAGTSTSAWVWDTEVAQLANGNIAVAWTSGQGLNDHITVQVVQKNGTLVGGSHIHHDQQNTDSSTPILAALPGGGFVAIYRVINRPNGDISFDDGFTTVRLRYFDNSGQSTGPAINVATGLPGGLTAALRAPSDVLVTADGRVFVLWTESLTYGGVTLNNVMMQEYTSDGRVKNDPVLVNKGLNQQGIGSAKMAISPLTGDIIVTWGNRMGLEGGDGYDIVKRVVHIGDKIDARFNNSQNVVTLDAGGEVVEALGGNDVVTGGAGNDAIDGGSGNDTLHGEGGNDALHGGDGNDIINGGNGDDYIDGGAGNDVLNGDAGKDTIFGGANNDQIHGGDGDDLLIGEGGDDHIEGGDGNDRISGDADPLRPTNLPLQDGDDTLFGGNGDDWIEGGGGNDHIEGGSGNDVLRGGDGDDYLDGGTGVDSINGGAGNDTIKLSAGNDTVNGGAGENTLDASNAHNVVISMRAGIDGAGWIDSLIGGLAFRTTFYNIHTIILGASGGEVVTTHTGNKVVGGTGAIDVEGGNGDDTLFGGSANDSLNGMGGSDLLRGGGGNDTLDGGEGTDIAAFSGAWKDYTITKAGSVYTVTDRRAGSPDGTDTLTNIETLRFSNGDFAINTTLNDAPTSTVITSKTAKENSAFTFNASTHFSDADATLGDSLTFSILNAPSWLKINATTGVLSGKPGFTDAAAARQVTVMATDSHGATAQRAFALTVTDTNRAPTNVTLSNASVAENRAAGTMVGTLGVIDPDGTTGAKLKLTSNPGGLFKIVGNKLQTAKPLDFETAKSHAVTIMATDAGGLTKSKRLTIVVEDVVDVINGNARDNTLVGAGGIDDIRGQSGNDTLFGKAGDDILNGGKGHDVLVGGPGGDTLIGGTGKDTASYQEATTGVTASLANAKANTGEAKGDSYSSIENLTGSAKNDTLTGDKNANVIEGLGGNDTLTGGGGADRFVFNSVEDSPDRKKAWDIITDFNRKQGDKIDLSAIDAQTGKGNQAFDFIGNAAFSGKKGELRFEKTAKSTFVYGDTDGDGKADLKIELAKAMDLRASDFVL